MCVSDRLRRLCAGVLCWIFGVFTPTAWSESGFEHSHVAEGVGAHVHGEARMQVSLQGSSLDIRLVIPAMDLLGYERPPKTVDERTRFNAARDFLEHPDNWIELIAEARCTLQSDRVEHPYKTDEHHHNTKTAHTDFVINANWQCAGASRLNSLTLSLFKQFARVREVKVDWIGDSASGIAQLTTAEPRLFLHAPQ